MSRAAVSPESSIGGNSFVSNGLQSSHDCGYTSEQPLPQRIPVPAPQCPRPRAPSLQVALPEPHLPELHCPEHTACFMPIQSHRLSDSGGSPLRPHPMRRNAARQTFVPLRDTGGEIDRNVPAIHHENRHPGRCRHPSQQSCQPVPT